MGIHGLYAQIGPGTRISLAKLSALHFTRTGQPFRLAVDISIWLFQIQSGKGGSNPALRTFYYRLLRLLTLNIHPLFVFDGPNKPTFKRNKRVGGPGVRVVNVPEFLAKQLLKQFGFPWHVAPGEAEAECALLQREGLVDAVLSEDVDTLMFGSGLTLRNWTAEGTSSAKVPTHVTVYRADETLAASGMDGQGMVLVALMSGGDYLPDGIPGCGPKLACDAARAGFGKELCTMRAKDTSVLQEWRERLTREIQTNESKLFSRKTPSFRMPEDWPNLEVLGYYTTPCVSNPEKIVKLKDGLQWDQPIDYAALRSFAGDAFDWRCMGGAKKFIRNLAPAILVRELRLRGELQESLAEELQEERERELITAIHGTRNHVTTDGELEYRISFTPANLVPIDLSIEDEDDEFLVAGENPNDSDPESEMPDILASPTKKRAAKPYDPSQPEKIWLLKPVLQMGCPLLLECYEASLRDPKEFLKARRKAKAATSGAQTTNIHASNAGGQGGAKGTTRKARNGKAAQTGPVQVNTLTAYTRVTKAGRGFSSITKEKEKETGRGSAESAVSGMEPVPIVRTEAQSHATATSLPSNPTGHSGFTLPSTRVPSSLFRPSGANDNSSVPPAQAVPTERTSQPAILDGTHDDFGKPASRATRTTRQGKRQAEHERTPRTKRRSPVPSSPATAQSQKSITSFFSVSPQKANVGARRTKSTEIVSLLSSPIEEESISRPQEEELLRGPGFFRERDITPTPPNVRFNFIRSSGGPAAQVERGIDVASFDGVDERESFGELPDTVTKRRRRREPQKRLLSRSQTAPVLGYDGGIDDDLFGAEGGIAETMPDSFENDRLGHTTAMDLAGGAGMTVDLITPSPIKRTDLSARNGGRQNSGDGRTARILFPPNGTSAQQAQMDQEELRRPRPFEPPLNFETDEDEDGDELPELPPPSTLNPNQRIPTASSRNQAAAAASVPAPTNPPTRTSPRTNLPRKQKIQLRESLDGAWKAVDDNADEVDLTGARSINTTHRAWRLSRVQVLDLTGE